MTPIVLFGGPSDERHVSVASAQNIARVLPEALLWFWAPEGAVYDVSAKELLAHEDPFERDYVPSRPAIWPDVEQALDTLPVDDPLFILGLHGTAGEDGTLQRLLEARSLPFTGSGSVASANAFDKERAKSIVHDRVRTAESRVARDSRELERVATEMLQHHERIVAKPVAGGSSRGLFFLKRGDAIPSVPLSVPSHTASIVHRTTASCPAVAAMFAATNGSVARSGSSLPCVQLKISFSLIVLAPP